MAPVAIALVLLLMSLLGIDGADVSCPEGCRCTAAILNCSKIVGIPRMERVPVPKHGEIYNFHYLDFTGNAISYIGEEIWQFYTLALHVNLKGNRLTRLQTSSLKGLSLVTHLDLSCNIIQHVGKNAFEDVPFLQSVNLSGNIIEQVPDGTFKTWHGMQHLSVVDLSHNPLTIIQDTYLYRLPSLNFLDLAASKKTLEVLGRLLQTSLAPRTLIMPRKISCYLCQMKDDVEGLYGPLKLKCTGSCTIKTIWCENQEPWNRMQEQLLKALERRKVDGSSLLTIIPGRTVTKIETSMLSQELSSSIAAFTISDFLKQLIKQKARELLDVNWDDNGQLENLYPLVRVLEASLQEKGLEADKESLEMAVQNELPARLSGKSADETSRQSVDISAHRRIGRDRRAIAKATMSSRGQHSILQLHNEDQLRRKLPESVKPQRVLSFPQPRLFARTLTKEELLYHLLKRSKFPVANDKSEISDPFLNNLSPDIMSHGTYLEPHRTSLSAPSQENHYQQASRFEDEVNKQLMPLISNTPLRELISHLIRVLKMECVEPRVQMTCSEVSSRTGLLLKLISDRLSKNGTDMTNTSFRELEKPLDEVTRDKKVVWAIVVAVIIAVMIVVTCVMEILSWHSAAKHDSQGRIFNGQKPLPDEECPRTGCFERDNPLWMQDTFVIVDEMGNTEMRNQETLREQPQNIPSWDTERPAPMTKPSPAPAAEPSSVPSPPPGSSGAKKYSAAEGTEGHGKGEDYEGGSGEKSKAEEKEDDEGD